MTPEPWAGGGDPMRPSWGLILITQALLLGLVCLAYSNHFHNGFHFDDYQAIQANPYIRDLHNVGALFTDARTNDALPSNQTYRPVTMASLALDYRLGNGLNPVWFHLSTFLWYLVQLALMFFLFWRIFDSAMGDYRNAWAALFASALYGVHPAMAETVNYIYQRGDLYATLAVIAGLVAYIRAPSLRRTGLYLLPVAIGLFSKQTTVVFPAVLFAWLWLFEERSAARAALRSLPAFVVVGALALFVYRMNAPTFTGGATSAFNFRISQPAVLLSYFRRFFLPLDLSADTDRQAYTRFLDPHAVCGYAFIAVVLGAIAALARRRETRPIAFGLIWFLVSCLPTSVVPLAEVENDHRLFMPFVGLALAVTWAAALCLYRHPLPRALVASLGILVLGASAWGAHERNRVWSTDETLWMDVTKKSPGNGRGLMNYGLTQMAQGRYGTALDVFNRALVLAPRYYALQINLGVAYGAIGNGAEAERHFQSALSLQPASAEAEMFYARWLSERNRDPEAIAHLRHGLVLQPDNINVRYLLMDVYAKKEDAVALKSLAGQTLELFPSDSRARGMLDRVPAIAAREAEVAREQGSTHPP